MEDIYQSFEEVFKNEEEGIDYSVIVEELISPASILALHGGGIEPGTEELAKEVHRLGEGLFVFSGIKRSGNRALHVTSTKYDHPEAVKLVKESFLTVAIHGAEGYEPMTFVGGLCEIGIDAIAISLQNAGFDVSTDPPEKINGRHPQNIVNRNRRGKGVQVEITEAQRKLFFKGLHSRYLREYKTEDFFEYAKALRKGIDTAKNIILPRD